MPFCSLSMLPLTCLFFKSSELVFYFLETLFVNIIRNKITLSNHFLILFIFRWHVNLLWFLHTQSYSASNVRHNAYINNFFIIEKNSLLFLVESESLQTLHLTHMVILIWLSVQRTQEYSEICIFYVDYVAKESQRAITPFSIQLAQNSIIWWNDKLMGAIKM